MSTHYHVHKISPLGPPLSQRICPKSNILCSIS